MSLFVGLLAFPISAGLQDEVKVGVLMGSVVSAVVGAGMVRITGSEPYARTERASP